MTRLTFGAMPASAVELSAPDPPINPATCVPWPYSSEGAAATPPRVKS